MGHKEGESSLSGFSDAEREALKILDDMLPAIGFVPQEHGSITIVDLRHLQGAGGAPAFDLWQEPGTEPLSAELAAAALAYLEVHGQAAQPEERSAVEEADRIIQEPIEIVDVAKIEEEKRTPRQRSGEAGTQTAAEPRSPAALAEEPSREALR